jgi:hypothetical protein
LVLAIGEPLTEAVERGFAAIVEAGTPPALSEIAGGSATDRRYLSWHAFIAGMDLYWDKTRDFGVLSKDTLVAAFALSLILGTFDIANNRPEFRGRSIRCPAERAFPPTRER